MTLSPDESVIPSKTPRGLPLPWLIVGGTAGIVLAGTLLAVRATHRQNTVALSQAPKRVGTLVVKNAIYRIQHRYVGTLLAWDESKLGPQFISGYVTDVRVRPGAVVKKGEVLAIIEPERAQAQKTASAAQAQAIQAKLSALAKESERIQGLRKKGIVSENEAENKLAEVLTAMSREPFWLSELRVGRTPRGRPDLLAGRLGPRGVAWMRRLAPAAPAWANARFLRDVTLAPDSLDRREFLLAWVFATITGQHGQALTIAETGARRFGDRLFPAMAGSSVRRLRWAMVRGLPRALWRRLTRE